MIESEQNRLASLLVQWLRLHAPTVGGTGLIPSQGSSACCRGCSQNKIKIEYNKKYNRTFLVVLGFKNLPCNARNADSIPVCGTKLPHALVQLSP